MLNVLKDIQRVEKFLQRKAKKRAFQFNDAPDPRQQGKVVHTIAAIMSKLLMGLVAGLKTLRDVEDKSDRTVAFGPAKRNKISDTGLFRAATRLLDEDYLLGKLIAQVRLMGRDKMLKPAGLPFGVATVDGKNLATLSHDGGGKAHHRSSEHAEKWRQENQKGEYWLAPALRTTLVSAPQRPCIHQAALPPGQGEATVFPEVVTALDQAYGRSGLFEVITGDAGLCSLANANHVVASGYAYVFGLKGNQKSLFEGAQKKMLALAETTHAEETLPWERRNGTEIQRQLWRSIEFGSRETTAGQWDHLHQIWLVRQTTRDSSGILSVEDRLFITSLEYHRLKAHEVLHLVRSHWHVENDTFNSLDLQWEEDSAPWATQGNAVWALGLLRLMALNLTQHLRHCHLRKRNADTSKRMEIMPWRKLFDTIKETMLIAALRADGLLSAPS